MKANRNFKFAADERAVSETIATVLLLTITVGVVGAFSTLIIKEFSEDQSRSRADLQVQEQNGNIIVKHDGGDILDPAELQAFVNIGGQNQPINLDGRGLNWHIGEHVCIVGGAGCEYSTSEDYRGVMVVYRGQIIVQEGQFGLRLDPDGDFDGDGYTPNEGDCNDVKAIVNPGQTELNDGLDNDCDGVIDEGFDNDMDGFSTGMGDCDDTNDAISPGATEIANAVDDDCDGYIDEGFDADKDGFSVAMGDCDDNNAFAFPGRIERDNGWDDDCDGLVDEGFDLDGDGATVGYGGDCNDADGTIYPGATPTDNGIDNTCDGDIHDGFDTDGDGYAPGGSPPDCDEGNPNIFPGAPEVANGVDDDCDGVIDENFGTDSDLKIVSVKGMSAGPKAGDSITFQSTMRNDGSESTPPHITSIATSYEIRKLDGTLMTTLTSTVAGPIAGQSEKTSGSTAWTAIAGTYRVIVTADSTGQIIEADDTNNVKEIYMTIGTTIGGGYGGDPFVDVNSDGVFDPAEDSFLPLSQIRSGSYKQSGGYGLVIPPEVGKISASKIDFESDGDLRIEVDLQSVSNDIHLDSNHGSIYFLNQHAVAPENEALKVHAKGGPLYIEDSSFSGKDIELESRDDQQIYADGIEVIAEAEVKIKTKGPITLIDSTILADKITIGEDGMQNQVGVVDVSGSTMTSSSDLKIKSDREIRIHDAVLTAGKDMEIKSTKEIRITESTLLGDKITIGETGGNDGDTLYVTDSTLTSTIDNIELKNSADIDVQRSVFHADENLIIDSNDNSATIFVAGAEFRDKNDKADIKNNSNTVNGTPAFGSTE